MAKKKSLISLYRQRKKHVKGVTRSGDMQDVTVKYGIEQFISENVDKETSYLVFECLDEKTRAVLVDLIIEQPWSGVTVSQIDETLYRIDVLTLTDYDEEF